MRYIYLKILLTFLAILVVNLILATFFIARFATADFNDNLKDQLMGSAHMIAALVNEIGLEPDRRDELIDVIANVSWRTDMRITVMLPDGTVVADTGQNPALIDNHINRPEVQQAIAEGEGWSRRHSDTIGLTMTYVAVPLKSGDGMNGVVRVAMAEAAIREALYSGVYRSVLIGAFIAVAIAAILGVFMARNYSRPIELIKDAALKIAAGDFQYRLQIQRKDELSQVAESLNDLSAKLGKSFKTLHDEQARLQTMLGGISEQMVFVGSDKIVYMANAAFCRLFNLDPANVTGLQLDDAIANPGIQKFISNAIEDRAPVNFETSLTNPDGATLHFRLSASPVTTASGRFRGAIILFHDTSHIREMEHMRRDFMDNASHELKTPLSSILAVIETLEDSEPADPAIRLKFYKTIQANTTRLHNLINDMLDLSEIEQKKASLELAPADLCGMTREVVSEYLPAIEAKNIRLQFDLPQSAVTVAIDRKNLSKAVGNLVDNAIRYTDDGGLITIRLTQSPQAVRIDVQDTGIGIAPRDIERIFERFYRVDKARSIKSGGTGLGLAIARHIVEAHNGRLSVQSTPGHGSVFSIILPA